MRSFEHESQPLAARLVPRLFLTSNVVFIAINGLVGLSLAPRGWLATLPVTGYVLGSAISTLPVARMQVRLGRKRSFQIGLVVAALSAMLCAYAAASQSFWMRGRHAERRVPCRQCVAVPLCRAGTGRPLSRIARQPVFIVAVVSVRCRSWRSARC